MAKKFPSSSMGYIRKNEASRRVAKPVLKPRMNCFGPKIEDLGLNLSLIKPKMEDLGLNLGLLGLRQKVVA